MGISQEDLVDLAVSAVLEEEAEALLEVAVLVEAGKLSYCLISLLLID